MGGIMVGGLSPCHQRNRGTSSSPWKTISSVKAFPIHLPLWGRIRHSHDAFLHRCPALPARRSSPEKMENAATPHFTGFDKNQTPDFRRDPRGPHRRNLFWTEYRTDLLRVRGCSLNARRCRPEKAIAAVPWSTIILICGMSVLISVVSIPAAASHSYLTVLRTS